MIGATLAAFRNATVYMKFTMSIIVSVGDFDKFGLPINVVLLYSRANGWCFFASSRIFTHSLTHSLTRTLTLHTPYSPLLALQD